MGCNDHNHIIWTNKYLLPRIISCTICVFQGQWGTTASQEEVDMRLRKTFVEEKVPSLRSEFVVLHDSFKVGVGENSILLYLALCAIEIVSG